MPVYESYNAFNEQFDVRVSRLGIMYCLQIGRSVPADKFLMVIHIRETGSVSEPGSPHRLSKWR